MNPTLSAVEADERGLVLNCSHCGKRNRLAYERLGQVFRCGECRRELPPPGEPIEIDNEAVFAGASAAALPVLADFWAAWCGPCKMVAPELAKVAAETAGKWLIVKVNTERLSALAHRFQVSAIPTLIVLRAGQEVARQAGALPAVAIRQFMQRFLHAASRPSPD